MKTKLFVFWGESLVGLIKPLIVLYFINLNYGISIYSDIVFINLILSIANNVFNLKIPSYLVKLSNQKNSFENFINNLNSLLLHFGFVLFLSGVCIIHFLNLGYSYLLIDLILIITILINPLKGIMIVTKKLNHMGIILIGSKISFIILFLFSTTQKVTEFVNNYLVLLLIENLLLFIFLFWSCNSIIKFRFQKIKFSVLSDFFKYVLSFFGINLLKSILKEIDKLIITYAFDKELLGMYDIGKKLFIPLTIFVSPFNLIFLKSSSEKLLVEKNLQYFKKKIIKTEFFMILFFILYLLSIIISYDFLKLNLKFDLLSIFLICCIGVIVFFESILWWPPIITTQITMKFAFINLSLKTFVTLTIVPILIYFYGLQGLIFAMILGRIFSFTFWRFYVLKSKNLINMNKK